MMLSEHFSLEEGIKSQTALRLGIDNTPPAVVIDAMRKVAENILEPVRDRYGVPFSPSSWFRCPQLNRLIGSKPTSQHITGEAVDFEVPGVPNRDLAHWISVNLSYDQVILECWREGVPGSGWVHASYADRLRGVALTYDGKQYRVGIPT